MDAWLFNVTSIHLTANLFPPESEDLHSGACWSHWRFPPFDAPALYVSPPSTSPSQSVCWHAMPRCVVFPSFASASAPDPQKHKSFVGRKWGHVIVLIWKHANKGPAMQPHFALNWQSLYPSVFSQGVHHKTINARRVGRQAWNDDVIGARNLFPRILSRQFSLGLNETFAQQPNMIKQAQCVWRAISNNIRKNLVMIFENKSQSCKTVTCRTSYLLSCVLFPDF